MNSRAHLSNLKYRGLIATWYDQEIRAGEEWMRQIDIYLNKAHIILLLISSDFMASEYCYSKEMKRALERHERREADVIPILLRPVQFTDAPFAKLQMLPTNGKPVIQWRYRDSAFVDIAYGIEEVALKHLPGGGGYTSFDPGLAVGAEGFEDQPSSAPASQSSQPHPKARSWRVLVLPLGIGAFVVALAVAGILALLQHPTLIPLVIYLFIGLLLLTASVVAALKVIGVIRARIGQRRAQEAREVAHRRRYYEEAIEAYRRNLSYNPSDGDAYRGMGNALYALGS